MTKKQISLSTDMGREMITLLKRIYDCGDFEIPRPSGEEAIAAELKEARNSFNKLTFIIYNNGKSGFKFDLEITYSRKKLCMLHTQQPHKNRDGTRIEAPHLHLYQEGCSNYDAIAFPYLRDQNNLSQSILDFLQYCNVENINELPLQLELGM